MFAKYLVPAVLFALSGVAAATDLSLEPCVNGAVSKSGNFPTQSMEREIYAYLDWRSYDPYYLFAVTANYLEDPFLQPEGETAID
jgi:hypothetical protein